MAESIEFSNGASRSTIYREIEPQIKAIVEGEPDIVANLANIAAVLKEAFRFFWVGFYLEKNGELVLGPFQGPLACTRIKPDEGVCGHCFSTQESVIVPDVDKFPGHIACSSAARSEIVLPIFRTDGTVFGVLDVDSDLVEDFSETDKEGLIRIVGVIESFI